MAIEYSISNIQIWYTIIMRTQHVNADSGCRSKGIRHMPSPALRPAHALGAPPRSMRLPARFARYFWDCDVATLNLTVHGAHIAGRILRYGDPAAVRWLLRRLQPEALRVVVRTSRQLDNKTRAYWRIMLHDHASAHRRVAADSAPAL